MVDRSSNGVYAKDRTWAKVDDLGAQRKRLGLGRTNRSAVAADALDLGVAALETLEDEPATRRIAPQEQKAIVREALREYIDRHFSDA